MPIGARAPQWRFRPGAYSPSRPQASTHPYGAGPREIEPATSATGHRRSYGSHRQRKGSSQSERADLRDVTTVRVKIASSPINRTMIPVQGGDVSVHRSILYDEVAALRSCEATPTMTR